MTKFSKTKTIVIYITILFGILFFAKVSLAADYYVDNTCANNGNGLSQTCASSPGGTGPFKSLANAQSSFTGNQSDNRLLFKKGQSFSGLFTVGCYGTAGHPVTISSYGTGANPVLSGANSGAVANISIVNKDYVTIDGFTIPNSSPNLYSRAIGSNSNGTVVQNCTIYDNAGGSSFYAIYIAGPWPVLAYDCKILNNTVYGFWAYAIRPVDVTGIIISGNEAYNNATGIYLQNSQNGEIYDNYCHDNTGIHDENYGIAMLGGNSNKFYNNRIIGNHNQGMSLWGGTLGGTNYGSVNNNEIYNNYFENNHESVSAGLTFASSETGQWAAGNKIHHNIFVSNPNLGLNFDNTNTQFAPNLVYNNTFYNNVTAIASDHANPGVEIKNNIFYGNSNADIWLPGSNSLTHNNNLYYYSNAASTRVNFNGVTYNLTEVKNKVGGKGPFETSCQNTNPKLVSTSDFHLLSDSPSINAGVDVGLTQDYEGNPIIGLPDIGAYEYVSSTTDTTPPTAPSGVAVN